MFANERCTGIETGKIGLVKHAMITIIIWRIHLKITGIMTRIITSKSKEVILEQ